VPQAPLSFRYACPWCARARLHVALLSVSARSLLVQARAKAPRGWERWLD
jgi:hypothetical protein